jgi:hypothetical protein
MAEKVINLTPHSVHMVRESGEVKIYPPSGTVARVEVLRISVGEVDGIPVYESRSVDCSGLPEREPGTWYIVSRAVAAAVGRDDLLVPDELVRDENGNITGAKSFALVK